MLMRNLSTVVFLLVWLVPSIICAAPSHKHSINKERLEDAFALHEHTDDEGEHHYTEFDHEAILGSVKEAEEFDNLPPEESKRRLGVLVQKMDTNGDGYIDRHELKAWILRSFKKLSEEEAEDRFEDLDENNDEKISWDEYVKDVYGMDSAGGVKRNTIVEPEESKLMEDDKQMFRAADLDKDGFLSLDEHVKFHSPEEHPEMLPLILKQTLRDKDLNKDGRIDFQEYIGDQGAKHDREWLMTEKDKFDTDFDKDNDGYLNHIEILSWVVPSNDDVATEEVNHLFAAADEDHDDRLSYKEIIDKYDIFVGSEATDYGDHLQNIEEFHEEL